MSTERHPLAPTDVSSTPEPIPYPGISEERLDAAAISDPLQEFRRNAGGIFSLPRLSTSPKILHFLLLNSADRSAAFEAWRMLKAMDAALSTDTLIHLVLNVQYHSLVLEAWRLAVARLDLTREQMRNVALHAVDSHVREEASAIIGR